MNIGPMDSRRPLSKQKHNTPQTRSYKYMTLVKELIEIPERVHRGDFVLKLAEDIKRPDAVVDDSLDRDDGIHDVDLQIRV